ncbi:MAG: hypothetical protein AAGA35_04300 [Patescibacteria group bacterium]
MAAKKQNKKSLSTNQQIGIGVGLTAAAVTAAGAYFLYGSKNAARNRKAVKSWMLMAKAEVLESLEDAKEMTQEEYEALIESVAKTYTAVKSASKNDIAAFKKEMKLHWKEIEKTAKPVKKAATRVVKKAAGRVSKKVTKKTAKKSVKKTAKKVAKKK